jgi:hypothetical protein
MSSVEVPSHSVPSGVWVGLRCCIHSTITGCEMWESSEGGETGLALKYMRLILLCVVVNFGTYD